MLLLQAVKHMQDPINAANLHAARHHTTWAEMLLMTAQTDFLFCGFCRH